MVKRTRGLWQSFAIQYREVHKHLQVLSQESLFFANDKIHMANGLFTPQQLIFNAVGQGLPTRFNNIFRDANS
jgi:hypothetical protein